ncbi:putative lipid-transfer protein DIR1 [Prosopis cineraria]|uniref:putative lipid-transfer protein DIR1 n=1 Tax=Prosopis cineraria TaxID=364024 RepID=UPI00240FA479|nr:putative lipid-transfer protein DIR1 [Prosopis cineraria]
MAIKLLKAFMVLIAATIMMIGLLGGKAESVVLCNTDSTKLNLCRAAVTGSNPPPPTQACCAVVRHVNMPCLCKYKSVLPSLGIDPKNALALPAKCGLRSPQCPGK